MLLIQKQKNLINRKRFSGAVHKQNNKCKINVNCNIVTKRTLTLGSFSVYLGFLVSLLIYSKYKKITDKKSTPDEAVSMISKSNAVMKTSKKNDESNESNLNLLDIHGIKDSILNKLGIETNKEVKINNLDAIIENKEVKIENLDSIIENKEVKIENLDSIIETKKLLIESLNIDFLLDIKNIVNNFINILDYICKNINYILQIFDIIITIPDLIYGIICIWLFIKVMRLLLKIIGLILKILKNIRKF